MRYRNTNTTVDADLFSMEIEAAIAMRFLGEGNVLVLDNAANHTGRGNTMLEDWLWEDHSVLVLFLPARAPEWNPIELMWNCLTQRLKYLTCQFLQVLIKLLLLLQQYLIPLLTKRIIDFTRRVECLHCMSIRDHNNNNYLYDIIICMI